MLRFAIIENVSRSVGVSYFYFKGKLNSMGFRFRKSIKILPGVRLNIGKKGINSTTIGKGWTSTNVGRNGISQNFNLPGTGISYRTKVIDSNTLQSSLDSDLTKFFVYFFFIAIIIIGLAAFSHYWQEFAGNISQSQTEVDKYAENLPSPSTSNPATNGGKTVQVRGYTRKDGTYVAPHTRSAPSRKK